MGIPINQPVLEWNNAGFISSKWRYLMGHPKKIEETTANLPESQFVLLVLFLFPEKVQKKNGQIPPKCIKNDPLLQGAGLACAGIFAVSLLLTFLTREEPSFRGKDRPVEHESLGSWVQSKDRG